MNHEIEHSPEADTCQKIADLALELKETEWDGGKEACVSLIQTVEANDTFKNFKEKVWDQLPAGTQNTLAGTNLIGKINKQLNPLLIGSVRWAVQVGLLELKDKDAAAVSKAIEEEAGLSAWIGKALSKFIPELKTATPLFEALKPLTEAGNQGLAEIKEKAHPETDLERLAEEVGAEPTSLEQGIIHERVKDDLDTEA
ncbi:MAG: hypothetical protein ABII07_01975 [Patescibacteria group bacterium]|nr:hypothetical protein [Patescibacteria group bacterium]